MIKLQPSPQLLPQSVLLEFGGHPSLEVVDPTKEYKLLKPSAKSIKFFIFRNELERKFCRLMLLYFSSQTLKSILVGSLNIDKKGVRI